jgi:hypothetical protein
LLGKLAHPADPHGSQLDAPCLCQLDQSSKARFLGRSGWAEIPPSSFRDN